MREQDCESVTSIYRTALALQHLLPSPPALVFCWAGVPSRLLVPASSSSLSPVSLELWLMQPAQSHESCLVCVRDTLIPSCLSSGSTPSSSYIMLLGNAASPQSWGYFWRIFAAAGGTKQPRNSAEGFAAAGRAGFNCPCSSTSPSTCSRQPKPQKLDAPCEEHNVHLVLTAKTWRMIFKTRAAYKLTH